MAASIGNKYALGNKGGRPPAYETPEELEKEVESFFWYCLNSKVKATITGLTLYLGFSSRSSLDDYCNKSQEFAYILKRAKLAVENSYELSGQAIDIFALKNMGWKDKHEVEQSGGINIKFQDPGDYVYPSADQSDSGIPESL